MPHTSRTPTKRAACFHDDDRLLIKAVGAGDQDAFRSLYQRHHDCVFAFVTGIVSDRALAEDITNEVFLALWRSATRYEGRAQPRTWLLSIARNQAISALRKKREITGAIDDATYNLADTDDGPERRAEKADQSDVLRRCLAKLTPAHRSVVDLVYYQECSVSEAAEILDLPPNTVKTRMFYARKKLSGLLADVGLSPDCVAA